MRTPTSSVLHMLFFLSAIFYRLEDVPEFITRVLPKPHSGDELIQAVADLVQARQQ